MPIKVYLLPSLSEPLATSEILILSPLVDGIGTGLVDR